MKTVHRVRTYALEKVDFVRKTVFENFFDL